MKYIVGIMLFSLGLMSCNPSPVDATAPYNCPMHCEGEKTYTAPGQCPVCKMDLVVSATSPTKTAAGPDKIDERSIFNLTSEWHNQDNQPLILNQFKGRPIVLAMIYTKCQSACPRLIADLKHIQQKVNNPEVHYVLVSIDPVNDTPDRLKAFAQVNELDATQWSLLTSDLDNTREFSNVLAVKYKRISPVDFSHSNIISVIDKAGVLTHQQEGLNVDNSEVLAAIRSMLVAK